MYDGANQVKSLSGGPMTGSALENRRSSTVEEGLSRMEKGLCFLSDVISDLEARLVPVLLSPTPEVTGCGQAVPIPQMSPVGSHLDHLSDRILVVRDRLESIISRIDL